MSTSAATKETGDDLKVTIQAGDSPYWVEGRWRVFAYPDEGTCEIGVVPKEGEYLSLQFDPKDSTAVLMITNKAATSKRDGEVVRLNMVFVRGDVATGRWTDVEFAVKVMPDGTRALVSSWLASGFLDRFAADEALLVMTPAEAVVGGSLLDGSSKAISQLRKCAFEAAGLNPDDPFLKQ